MPKKGFWLSKKIKNKNKRSWLPYLREKMFSPGTWPSLCEQQETRSLAKLSSSLPSVWGEGNRKCHLGKMNDRGVISIYEVEDARTHLLSCLAVIEVCCVCMRLCEINKGV